MLKTFVKIVAVLMIAVSAHAGTAGGDANGRLYNTAYYDVTVEGQNTMMEYLKYSKRGGFDIEAFNAILTGFEKNADINIYTRVIVPADITSKEVYVSVGSQNYSVAINRGGPHLAIRLDSYWNNEKPSSEYIQVKPKTDQFGNRYVDYNLKGLIVSGRTGAYANASDFFNSLRFYVAPVSRGFKNKFQKADIYVLDE